MSRCGRQGILLLPNERITQYCVPLWQEEEEEEVKGSDQQGEAIFQTVLILAAAVEKIQIVWISTHSDI